MPKSRHRKGKHHLPGKKRKIGQASSVATAPSPDIRPPAPAARSVPTPPAATVAPKRHPYLVSDLKRIGVVAAITLLLLVVLARVLSRS